MNQDFNQVPFISWTGITGLLIRGFASTGFFRVIAVAYSKLHVPLFIKAWGADGYGRWLSLTALISYLCLMAFGGKNFIGNQLLLGMTIRISGLQNL